MESQLKDQQHLSTKYPQPQRLLLLHFLLILQLQHHPSLPPSVTTTRTSTRSVRASEETIEAVAAIEANVAKVGLDLIASQTPRPRAPTATTATTTPNHHSHRALADGTASLEKRASNVARIALDLNPSRHLSRRETAKGAVECECGDPLLIIYKFQKQSSLHPRCNDAPKMVD